MFKSRMMGQADGYRGNRAGQGGGRAAMIRSMLSAPNAGDGFLPKPPSPPPPPHPGPFPILPPVGGMAPPMPPPLPPPGGGMAPGPFGPPPTIIPPRSMPIPGGPSVSDWY